MQKTLFGKMPDGKEVFSFRLTNRRGAAARILNLGAVVQSLIVPNREGCPQDVVLGFDTAEAYLAPGPYFGAIVGRYGNRIRKGRFELDGKTFELAVNNGVHHLHGGFLGFDKKYWEIKETDCKNGTAVCATVHSPDGEEGYPGKVSLTVTIRLTDDNALRFDYEGTCDRTTLLNPTHHGYFNLTGDPNHTILDHEVQIDADGFTSVDETLIPTGEVVTTANTPLDFRAPVRVGGRIDADFPQLRYAGGYDHNFVLNNYEKGRLRKVAHAVDPGTGRTMTVFTDQPGMQFYTGNFLDGTLNGKGGTPYKKRCGLCFEAQHYPDSPNQPGFPGTVLRPEEVYRQTTAYQFSIV